MTTVQAARSYVLRRLLRAGAAASGVISIAIAGAHPGGVIEVTADNIRAACASPDPVQYHIISDHYSAATMWTGFPANCERVFGIVPARRSAACIAPGVTLKVHAGSFGGLFVSPEWTFYMAQFGAPSVERATIASLSRPDPLALFSIPAQRMIARGELAACPRAAQ